MKRESKIILTVTVVAAVTLAWCVYWTLADGLPLWVIGFFALFIIFFAALALHGFLPNAEEKLTEELAANAKAVTTSGVVLDHKRSGTSETTDRRYSHITLTLSIPLEGSERQINLNLRVEDALLPRFASGQTIHLLYDQADPSRFAVDRRLTPVEIL